MLSLSHRRILCEQLSWRCGVRLRPRERRAGETSFFSSLVAATRPVVECAPSPAGVAISMSGRPSYPTFYHALSLALCRYCVPKIHGRNDSVTGVYPQSLRFQTVRVLCCVHIGSWCCQPYAQVSRFKGFVIGGGGLLESRHWPLDCEAFVDGLGDDLPVAIFGVGAG